MKNYQRILVVVMFSSGLISIIHSCKKEKVPTEEPEIPSVETYEVTGIEALQAVGTVGLIYDGGSNILERGVCWSTESNPTIDNEFCSLGIGAGADVNSCKMTGLNEETKYFVRAFARNSVGIGYGNEVSFTTKSQYHAVPHIIYTTADGLVDNWVYDIAIDAKGNKWFGTHAGVSKFDDTSWTTYTTANGLADNNIHAISVDAQDNKWFGTNGGVSKFDGTTWTTYTAVNGLASDTVTAIAIDAQGNKWFGTTGGVSKFSVACK